MNPNTNLTIRTPSGANSPISGNVGIPARSSSGQQSQAPTYKSSGFTLGDLVGADNIGYSVGLSIDPKTYDINVNAPQWFVDSDVFKEELLPYLQKLEGMDIDSAQFQQLMSPDNIQKLNKQLEDSFKLVTARNELKTELSKTIKNVTDNAAKYALYNISQATRSDNDQNTQVITGTNKDGSIKTKSIADVVTELKSLSDTDMGRRLKQWQDIYTSDSYSPEDRAIALSLSELARSKGLTGMSLGTELSRALREFNVGAYDSFVGRVLSAPSDLLSGKGWGGTSATTREQLDADITSQLDRGNLETIGSIAGTIAGIGGDIALSIPTGGAIATAASGGTRLALNLIPKASSAATRAEISLASKSPGVASFLSRAGRETAENVTFGVTQALAQDDYDFANNLLLDTGISAGAIGAARLIKRGVQQLDTSVNGTGKLAAVNEKISQGIFKVANDAKDIPGLGKAIKSVGENLISSTSQAERALTRAYSAGKITKDQVKQGYNMIKASVNGSGKMTENILQSSPAYREAYALVNKLEKAGTRNDAINYVVNRTNLDRADAGMLTMTKAQREAAEAAVSKYDSGDAREYYETLVRLNDEITAIGGSYGILDEDIIRLMQESGEFADNYIHLQFDINSRTAYTGVKTASRSQKSTKPVRRLKGGTSTEGAADPILTAVDRLAAFNNIKLQNDVMLMFKELGLATVVEDAVSQAALFRAKAVREAAKDATERAVEGADGRVSRLLVNIDDIEDPLGRGRDVILDRIDGLVDDIVEDLAADSRFVDAVIPRINSEGVDTIDVAAEAVSRNRKLLLDKVDKALVDGSDLGPEARKEVVDLVKRSIDRRAGKGVLSSALADNAAEIKRLNAELSAGKEGIDEGVRTADYFENGARGKLAFNDPDLADYFTSNFSTPATGMVWDAGIAASRAFRAGTTGMNPIFNLVINPIRDVTRSAVTAGTAVVTPRSVVDSLIKHAKFTPEQARAWHEAAQQARRDSLWNSTSLTFARREADRAAQYKDLKRLDRQFKASEGSKKMKVVNILKNPVRSTENFFNAVDKDGIRRNVFDAVLERSIRAGKTPEQALTDALFYADEASTSFWRSGKMTRNFVRTVPYLSAAINGQASFLRLWALDPIGVTSRLAAGIAAPTVFLTINNLNNDNYKNIPQYVKELNFIVMMPDDTYIAIPMDYDLARIINPFRDMIEGLYEGDLDMFNVLADAVLNSSPIDLGGFNERDPQGNVDLVRAASKTAASLLPQGVQAVYEAVTGRDLYTGGSLGPSDLELYEQGFEGEINPSDRTFASRNSRVLGWIADATGVPQSTIQNMVSNLTGSVGQFVVNALDKATGAPESEQGGRDMLENLGSRISGDAARGGRRQAEWYQMVDIIERERAEIQAQLEQYGIEDDRRQELIDKYSVDVAEMVEDYTNKWGELEGYRLNSVINLLNLIDAGTPFAETDARSGAINQVNLDARDDARRRAFDLGIQTSTAQDRVGRIFDNEGQTTWDYGNVSTIPSLVQNEYYGAPRQLAYEFNRLVSADRTTNTPSLYQEMQIWNDRISDLYDEAKGKKGAAATAAYKTISDTQEQYMREVFDPRIRPLIEKYGPSVLDNREVLDEISYLVMVPGDFTPFASRNKQPYLTDDTRAYLLDRYGVGRINRANRPSDEEAIQIINAINSDLDAGRSGAASTKLDNLMEQINAGQIYVDYANMDTIRDLIANANRRR